MMTNSKSYIESDYQVLKVMSQQSGKCAIGRKRKELKGVIELLITDENRMTGRIGVSYMCGRILSCSLSQ